MGNASPRSSVYWLLFADVLIRFGIANDPPVFFRIGGLFLHFLVGVRIGALLFSRLRPANLVTAAPLLIYGLSLIVSTMAMDLFSLAFQWILTLVLYRASVATNEASVSATTIETVTPIPLNPKPASPPPTENGAVEPRPGKWRIVLGIVLVCATASLNFYLAAFDTEGFNGMAVLFTHLFFYTPVLLSLSLPLLVASGRGSPLPLQWLFCIFCVLFILSWAILGLRAYGVW